MADTNTFYLKCNQWCLNSPILQTRKLGYLELPVNFIQFCLPLASDFSYNSNFVNVDRKRQYYNKAYWHTNLSETIYESFINLAAELPKLYLLFKAYRTIECKKITADCARMVRDPLLIIYRFND